MLIELVGLKPREIKRPDSKQKNIVLTVDTDLYQTLTTHGKVKIGYQCLEVTRFVEVTRCFKCYSFGHIAKHCNAKEENRCSICLGQHPHTKCPNKTKETEHKCVNCDKNPRFKNETDHPHQTMSSACPLYQEAFKNKKQKIDYFIANGLSN